MKKKKFNVKNSLYLKLVSTYFIVMIISFILLAIGLSFWFEKYYYNQRKQAMLSEAVIFNKLYEEYYSGKIEQNNLDMELYVLDKYLNTRIWIVDNYKFVRSVSNTEDNNLIWKQITNTEIDKVISKGEVIIKEGIFNERFNTSVLTIAYPIKIYNEIKGAVIMNSPIYEIKNTLRNVYFVIWIFTIFAIIVSTILIYYLSQGILIKPLNEINKTAKEISKGEFQKRVKIKSRDEIGQLAESFNYMADSLQNLENLRRDFIANVSHELRSPLTSIRGFVQGIIDGTIPEEKHEQYLNIVLNESKRLSRLISDILDLSRLESGQFSMNNTSFDINELIRINIIRFENEIENKKINVDVILTENELYTLGDRDRIGQVISNLIDNALKFTPQNGLIGIYTKIENKKVIVSVKDTGCGIAQNELKLIWDRFHMVDKSRTNKKGTGLGLSIARQIINQHGENIWVESKEKEGSIFSFSLKLDENKL